MENTRRQITLNYVSQWVLLLKNAYKNAYYIY